MARAAALDPTPPPPPHPPHPTADDSVVPLLATESARRAHFLSLDRDDAARALALAPPDRLPRPLGVLPKDVRRRLASAPLDRIREAVDGVTPLVGKASLGGYAGSDWTHGAASAPRAAWPQAWAADALAVEPGEETSGVAAPPGNETLLYLEAMRDEDRAAFDTALGALAGCSTGAEPERSEARPLSLSADAVRRRPVRWETELVMTPGTSEPQARTRGARLAVGVRDLQRALGLSDATTAAVVGVAGPRCVRDGGAVLGVSSRAWSTQEDNRRECAERLQRIVEEAAALTGQTGPEPSADGAAFEVAAAAREAAEAAAAGGETTATRQAELDGWLPPASEAQQTSTSSRRPVPRSGLESPALLAQWPRAPLSALAELESRLAAGETPDGPSSDRLRALDGVVCAQLRRDWDRTAAAAAEVEGRGKRG